MDEKRPSGRQENNLLSGIMGDQSRGNITKPISDR